MIVGFTGTRGGMTGRQLMLVHAMLDNVEVAHHGDCVGSDAEFHAMCEELGIDVVIHPPTDTKHQAFCHSTRIEEPKPYLERNRDIVDATEILIAAPAESTEPPPRRGQGTWWTVRYARSVGKSVHIIYPTNGQ